MICDYLLFESGIVCGGSIVAGIVKAVNQDAVEMKVTVKVT